MESRELYCFRCGNQFSTTSKRVVDFSEIGIRVYCETCDALVKSSRFIVAQTDICQAKIFGTGGEIRLFSSADTAREWCELITGHKENEPVIYWRVEPAMIWDKQ